MSKWQLIFLVGSICILSACGQSGSLYLPAQNTPTATSTQQG